MRILFFGDVFGKAGRKVISSQLQNLKKEFEADLAIINCENLASGRGITEKTSKEMFRAGVDIFTSGNHLWDRAESYDYIEKEKRITKPANYPEASIGNKYYIRSISNGAKIAVMSIVGQSFMANAGCPYEAMKKNLEEIHKITDNIFIDFHAESTAEKRTFGQLFDGEISAFVGTHTHIQTADEEVLPNGTAYITDVGMNGAHDSVIGVEKEIIFQKLITGMPLRYESANSGLQVNAVLIELDEETGKSIRIERIRRKLKSCLNY